MNRLLTAILLLLIAGSGFAESSTLSQTHEFASNLGPRGSDYSVAYLSQIFGTVGNTLQGTSGQVLGKMFEVFNKGVLVVAALWLGYSTISLALHAAYEGSFASQKNNAALIMLRIAFGFALIVPSATTGYSLLQDIFMKIVVQGVGLADQTWDAALKYIKYGGMLYIPPSTLTTSTTIISSAMGGDAIPGPVTQIFQDEVCMIKSQDWQKQAKKQLADPSAKSGATAFSVSPSSYTPAYHPVFTNAATGIIYFPGVGNPTDKDMNYYYVKEANGAYVTNASCGVALSRYYVSPPAGASGSTATPVPTASSSPSGASSAALTPGAKEALQTYSYTALKQMVISLMPAAQSYVDDEKPSNGKIKNNIKSVFSGILAYSNLITPYQNLLLNKNKKTDFISDAEAQGWIMAGSFYWDVEQTNETASTISVDNLLPTIPKLPSGPGTVYALHKDTLIQANTTVLNYQRGNPREDILGLDALWAQYVGAEQNNIETSSTSAPTSDGSGFASSMTSSSAKAVKKAAKEFSLGKEYNPIIVLMKEGNSLLTTVADMWAGAIALTLGVAVVAGICTASSPTGLVLTSILSWIKSILMIISSALLMPGAILAYYVPLYPFVVFTFAAVGWLLMVIEGMAAAPLVCVGITHPEGHDFLGKAEQALMLFLSIFLRPSLMILGLVAAMVTSFVAFHMLIIGFGKIMASIASTGGNALSNKNAFVELISFAMVTIIFGFMTMELIEQCYKLIFQLPNYILQWIGGPQTGQDFGQMASGVKGAVSSGSSSITEGARGIDQGLNALGGGLRKAEKALKDDGKSAVNPGSGGGGGG